MFRRILRISNWVIGLGLILFAPFAWLHLTTPIVDLSTAKHADAALIFGAIVRQGTISPLHAQRLQAGERLLEDGLVDVLVVSNAKVAAGVMRDYLVARGVPAEQIEIDGKAVATPDTCVSEAAQPKGRSVIMVSQRYHLPRIALQCSNLGIDGQYLAADAVVPAPETSMGPLEVLLIRASRHAREAVLIWTEILGVYRDLENRF